MALLNDILRWSENKLPLWQRDAVRRLFQKEDGLSSNDYAELYALLKNAHNLPNTLGLTPEPLKSSHIPTSLHPDETVTITALRDLMHVNLIAPRQKLEFSPTGMTVIFGGNGSGKSGYTRVMKQACRARDQSEKVHPNAYDPDAQVCLSEAVFDVEINGTPKSLKWISNSDSPSELATIAVFDSYCARAYLTAEQDVAYLPYGLDVVENLANIVLPELSSRLKDEIEGINIDKQPFDHLVGDTEVGQLISNLNHKTDAVKIKDLAALSKLETKRITELNKALTEADPILKANELRLSAERLKALIKRVESAQAWTSDNAVTKLKGLDNSAITANQAEKQAAETLQSGESLLPKTGEQTWKLLYEAARKYSTEDAYPGCKFPHTVDGALCPFCQQPLNDSISRLKRFEEYVQNDVAKVAIEKNETLQKAKERIENADLSIGLDKSLTEEITYIDNDLIPILNIFKGNLEERRTWMLLSLDTHNWDAPPALALSPRQKLRDLAARQLRGSLTFNRVADEMKKKSLEKEREELLARQNLSKNLDAVLSLIERMKMRHALEQCKKDLKTTPISTKSKEFASNTVTATLKNALNDEFKDLGIGHIKTKLKERGSKGKFFTQLLLDLPTNKKLEHILSEGEQSAIAIGSFLAELKLANHEGAIVFDDPVSSLDHKHRRKVAKRLAAESLKRQVLMFTHDVVFLNQLRDECEKLKAPPVISFLEASGKYYGKVSEGLPWGQKKFPERIDSLEKAQKSLEKLPWPASPSEDLARQMFFQYSSLRATIERVVQDFILNSTVRRFQDYINVKNLSLVVGLEQSEADEVFRLYKRCSEITEAHDPSSKKDEPPPTPDELKQDIDDLKSLIEKIKTRRQK